VEVEDEVQFADIVKVLVQDLDKEVNHFKHKQLIVLFIHNGDEVQTCISLINNFVIVPFQKIARFGVSGKDNVVDLFDVLLSFTCGQVLRIPFGHSDFALSVY
jgi:hypothetical protein